YGISAPISKLLLDKIHPTLMAALLYLGAGSGMLLINAVRSFRRNVRNEKKWARNDLPFIFGMIVLDIAAPVFLMMALTMTSAANISLINNFEIVATALIALFFFKETIGGHMWIAITLIAVGCMLLSVEDLGSMNFSVGSLFALLACICWGLENNFTRKLSGGDPLMIVVIKGFGSGTGALIIAGVLGQMKTEIQYLLIALLLGFFAYGLSIYFYISAQRSLGAARTSAYYAVAPFVGAMMSFVIFREEMTGWFVLASVFMITGVGLSVFEHIKHDPDLRRSYPDD
ncbi:MAG: DMT family transporter, partial [Oscillospiraceae bacterium]|nr:DMT family transporter [Oscillospiraceae bacterium]